MVSVWTLDEEKWVSKRHFLSQRLTKVSWADSGISKGSKKSKKKAQTDIENVYGTQKEEESGRQKLFKETLTNEERLWHNNIPLPYQKKIKRE